ncbi:MAG: AAA family ATPase [Streptosporangiales bacterium]|nr:AAA family ATPase [Streptosporangiales bacterium]
MDAAHATVVVVMGVSGSGKTTIGQRVAAQLGCEFLEGDERHPPANVAKMRAGEPLDDEDRRPWLRDLAGWIASRLGGGDGGVVACSALKRSYRDILRGGAEGVFFVHLAASREVISQRVASRTHDFMPADLLDSQFADLEPLQPDEVGVTVDVTRDRASIVGDIVAAIEAAR